MPQLQRPTALRGEGEGSERHSEAAATARAALTFGVGCHGDFSCVCDCWLMVVDCWLNVFVIVD